MLNALPPPIGDQPAILFSVLVNCATPHYKGQTGSCMGMMIMDVDKVIAVVTAAGIELTDRRRTKTDDGWSLSFSNGAELEIIDGGGVTVSGKGAEAVTDLLDLPIKS